MTNDTIHTWIENQDMPAHRIGRPWKFKVSEENTGVRSGKAAQKTKDEEDG